MRSSPEMRVSLVLRSILAVRGKSVLLRIDVVDYGRRALIGIENFLAEAIERDLGFPAEAPGKDGKRMVRGEAFEQTFAREPAFTENQAVVVLTQEDLLETRDYFFEIDFLPAVLNHAVRKLPVIVETAAILPGLNVVVRRFLAGEVANGGLYGGAVGFAGVH